MQKSEIYALYVVFFILIRKLMDLNPVDQFNLFQHGKQSFEIKQIELKMMDSYLAVPVANFS